MDKTDLDQLAKILEFLEEEAENRICAGSTYSDYAREPGVLAEQLRAIIEREERNEAA